MYIIVFLVIVVVLVMMAGGFISLIGKAIHIRRCLYCQKEVDKKAIICPHCHTTFVGNDKFL